ncbi:MAG: hypothetical protein NTY15_07370 [Planctomycetota bacterium]|nr:hypothetical protein [Planctomycetota bacterium]
MAQEDDSLRQIQVEIARVLTESRTAPIDCGSLTLSASDLEQSRETLIRKRISQTRQLLPRTALAMGLDFNSIFREFAATHHFNGSNAIAMDAIALARWLSETEIAMPWVGQLALWESMDCYWSTAKIYVKFFRLQYDFTIPFESGMPRKRRSFWCCWRVFAWSRKRRLFG